MALQNGLFRQASLLLNCQAISIFVLLFTLHLSLSFSFYLCGFGRFSILGDEIPISWGYWLLRHLHRNDDK